jgi:hypothetical protein
LKYTNKPPSTVLAALLWETKFIRKFQFHLPISFEMVVKEEVLSLLRSLLRAHKKFLPSEMRNLGDAYVRSEFRLHKSASNPNHISQFMTEWRNYLQHIEASAASNDQNVKVGRNLANIEVLDEEKRETLSKLQNEATRAGKIVPDSEGNQ